MCVCVCVCVWIHILHCQTQQTQLCITKNEYLEAHLPVQCCSLLGENHLSGLEIQVSPGGLGFTP